MRFKQKISADEVGRVEDVLPEFETEIEEIGKRMKLTKKERQDVYDSLGLSKDGE